MGPSVRLMVRTPAGAWQEVSSVSANEPTGSISSDDPTTGRRQVFVFGWLDGAPGVWRSRAGFDVANDAIREIHTTGLDLLTDFARSDFYELDLWRHVGPVRVGFMVDREQGAP
jgi:hypothetical protein